MVTTWAILAVVGLSGGQPPRPTLTPAEAETIPLYKVPGPAFKIPCRVPDRTRGVAGVELWVSLDGGRKWAKAETLPWADGDAAKEFEFHAKKSGEHLFAVRVQFKDGRFDPEKTSELEPAQRTWVLAGSDPVGTQKAAVTAAALDELDDELNRVEMDLIRKEMKELAASKEFSNEVADRIDRLRSRLAVLRGAMEAKQDRLSNLRTAPPLVIDPGWPREQPTPAPPTATSPGLPSIPPPRPQG